MVVFPAGQTYNFTTKGAARYVIINNADAKLIYKGAEYLPDENGIIKVLFDATGVTSVTVFQIVNTKDSDNEIGLSFEAIKGTQSNPYEAVVGQEYTVNIEPEISVYYSFTADKDGVLLVKSPTSVNSITLYNKTSYVSTNATNGAGASYIPVKMGDKVDITVALIQNAEASEVSFTLEFFDGSEQNPIVIYEAATLKIGKGMSYFFKASTELDISLEISSSVNINVNGGEENTDLILKSSGSEVIEIANNTEENADVTIIVNIE